MSFISPEDPVISRFYSEAYGDTPEVSRDVVEIHEEVAIEGENLDFDNTDPECGVFMTGAMGSIKLTELVEHRENKIVAIIPDFIRTGDYFLEIRRKNEEGCNFDFTYGKKIQVKGYVDTYHITKEDNWYSHGVKAGRTELAAKLVSWLEENGYYKKPDIRFIKQEPQQKVVVIRKK